MTNLRFLLIFSKYIISLKCLQNDSLINTYIAFEYAVHDNFMIAEYTNTEEISV